MHSSDKALLNPYTQSKMLLLFKLNGGLGQSNKKSLEVGDPRMEKMEE